MKIEEIDSSVMEEFDQKIWEEIISWQQKKNSSIKLPYKLEKIRNKAGEVASSAKERASELPGVGLVMESFQNSLQGLMDIILKTGESTVREKAVLNQYKKKWGYEFRDIDEILGLSLKEVIKTKPNLELKYSSVAMLEGGGHWVYRYWWHYGSDSWCWCWRCGCIARGRIDSRSHCY